MTSMLSRAIGVVRVWMGLNDPTDNRPHPSHGWLLPAAADVRARALASTAAPAKMSSAPPASVS